MRIVIFSDVHSNLEALDEMIRFLKGKKVDRYFMLGDVVGYGADPNACYAKTKALTDVIIKGNHEGAISSDEVLSNFTQWARDAILWTRKHIEQEAKDALEKLPLVRVEGDFTLVHGSLNRPEEFCYITSIYEAWPTFKSLTTPLCFIGHTHVPQIFVERERRGVYLMPGKCKLKKSERYIINVGSVGQPRDRDTRLAFAIFDTDKYKLELVRLDYDNQTSARKIREAGLPEYLAKRLL